MRLQRYLLIFFIFAGVLLSQDIKKIKEISVHERIDTVIARQNELVARFSIDIKKPKKSDNDEVWLKYYETVQKRNEVFPQLRIIMQQLLEIQELTK